MLVISAVNATGQLGPSRQSARIADQHALAPSSPPSSIHSCGPRTSPAVLARLRLLSAARPRPVHIEIPVDLMEREVEAAAAPAAPALPAPPVLCGLISRAWSRRRAPGDPLRRRRAQGRQLVTALAERLGAPLVMTVNGRGLLPRGHPLAVPASPSLFAVRRLVKEADVVLALGTELGPTDYDMYATGGFAVAGRLIRLDIDPLQVMRGSEPELALVGDCGATLQAMLAQIETCRRTERGGARRGCAGGRLWGTLARHAAQGRVRRCDPRRTSRGDHRR
jgi:acetolactate synthase-1/2/3 large subunit